MFGTSNDNIFAKHGLCQTDRNGLCTDKSATGNNREINRVGWVDTWRRSPQKIKKSEKDGIHRPSGLSLSRV